jgi:hypothetical protein
LPNPLPLTKISETASKITLGWTPVPGAVGYRFQSDTQAPKWSHTFDATRSQVTFSKATTYKVEALGVEAAGAFPGVAPPPPPPGNAYKTFADLPDGPWDNYFFLQRCQGKTWTGRNEQCTPWPDGSGIFNPSPGVFRFVTKGSVPQGSGEGIQLAGVYPAALDVSGKLRFPSSGNPQGFQTGSGDWNALWEWVDGSHTVFNQWGVDATGGQITVYVRTYNPQSGGTQKMRAPVPAQFYDVDHTFRWDTKLSKSSDGYVRFWFNGQQVMNYSGATVDGSWNLGKVWQQWGFYGDSPQHRNEIIFSDLVVA